MSERQSTSSRVVGGRTLRSGTRKSYVPPPVESSGDEEEDVAAPEKDTTADPIMISVVQVKIEEGVQEERQLPSRLKRRRASSELDDFEISKKKQKQLEEKIKVRKAAARAEAKAKAERRKVEKAREEAAEKERIAEEKIYQARVKKEAKWKVRHEEKKPNMPWKEGQNLHLFDLPAEILEQILALDQDFSIKDYMNVSATCWYLRLPFLDDMLWREIYLTRTKIKNPGTVYDVFGYTPSPSWSNSNYGPDSLQAPFAIGQKLVWIPLAAECRFQESIRSGAATRCAVRLTGHGQSKPIDKSTEERYAELVSQVNRYSEYSQCVRYLQQGTYKGISPHALGECRDILRFFTSRLPLSRTEASFFGIKSASKLQLNVRRWDYGPWQTLALRATNWPVISAKRAISEKWLSLEDLMGTAKVQVELQTESAPTAEIIPRNEPVGWYFAEDIKEISQDLKKLVSTRKKWRAEARDLLNEEARFKPAGTYCAECISVHEATSAKHRWWYTLPEYKSTDIRNIEKRIRKLVPGAIVCGCGMHYTDPYDDYDCFDSDDYSDYEYDLPFGFFEGGH